MVIPVVENRLLQGVAQLLCDAILEADFLPISYGYRPDVGAQQAVKDLTYGLQFDRNGIAVEADTKGFFDTIDHDWLKIHRHWPLKLLLVTLKRKVRGHYFYFRVFGNSRSIWGFYKGLVKQLYKWLNLRNQRQSLIWAILKRVLERFAFPGPYQSDEQFGNQGLA